MTRGPLTPLLAYRQFIVVKLLKLADGRTDKIPLHGSTLTAYDAHDPAAWTDFDHAAGIVAALGHGYGVGFVLTDNDPFFCLDIDSCATPEGGWSALAHDLCQRLPGCVIEVSQSGRGLHIWGRRSAMPAHVMKDIERHIELYSSKRFILLGSQQVGEMAEDCTAIDAVAAEFFAPRERSVAEVAGDGPCAEWRGPADDADLLRRALQSKSGSVFRGKATFADLWHGDPTALGRAYPPDAGSSEPYDRSSADAALAQHLSFWTGKDVARIERLMRQSALARPKWDDRGDYLVGRTITNACAMQKDVLQDAPSAVPEPARSAAAVANGPPPIVDVVGNTFLGAEDQKRLFQGCIYIQDVHRMLTPGGDLLKPDQVKATFGGYTFAIDRDAGKTTRNAWEAFTESQANRTPRANGTCFRPDLPYGTIVTEGGRARANFYWPAEVVAKPGDVSLFLDLVQRLFPNERDRRALMCWFARNVQSPGVKANWAPIVQGVEGNGKSFLGRVLAYCVGPRYVVRPNAARLTGQFNGWVYGSLLAIVEEIHTKADADILDQLKPLITGGEGVAVELKGVDQITREICVNFLFLTNHKNALKKTRNDRRFANFFCAQQSVEDLERDGLTEAFFDRLHAWFDNGGAEALAHYFRTYEIDPEFDFAGVCQRAPITSSTAEAIEQSLGAAEQAVMEAIDEGITPGLMGGWVSSMALDKLLDRTGKSRSVPINRRRDMMRSLGYDWHPGLPDGRVHNVCLPDGGKPRLYVAKGHPALALKGNAEIARAYAVAQGVGKP